MLEYFWNNRLQIWEYLKHNVNFNTQQLQINLVKFEKY